MEDPLYSEWQLGQKMEQLTNDVDRWQFVINNRYHPNMPAVQLDNDDTFITFYDREFDYDDPELDEDDSYICVTFDDYIGWGDGVLNLLQSLNISADGV